MDLKWLPEYRRYVTSDGRVFRITANGLLNECKQTLNQYGYKIVGHGYKRTIEVHRLIATAFMPNTEHKWSVDHINRVRTDNRVENLRWATQAEQMQNTCRKTSAVDKADYDKKWRLAKIAEGYRRKVQPDGTRKWVKVLNA